MRIALAKGRISKDSLKIFQEIGIGASVDLKSRKLIFNEEENDLEYILVKPGDVPTYVENGVADIGIVGSDVIMENNKDVLELFDLEFGKCKFSIACENGNEDILDKKNIRVATKYTEVTKKFFSKMDKKIEIIYLGGSVELAPIVGLSDVIVDIVETGSTLKANNLTVIKDMYDISARLICNKVSYQFNKDRIIDIVDKLKESKNASN